jgi:protein-S-isoprenylcysteine O-methyltransferase Ste14
MASRVDRGMSRPVSDGAAIAFAERGLSTGSPGIRVPAPFFHVGFLALGLVLRELFPLALPGADGLRWVGVASVLVLGVFSTSSSLQFARAHTSMLPNRRSKALITRGPYRISRNPIYLSLLGIHLGIGLWVGSGWLVASALPCFMIVDRSLIPREERHLGQRFGRRYLAYQRRVRRWI